MKDILYSKTTGFIIAALLVAGQIGLYCRGWTYEVEIPEELK